MMLVGNSNIACFNQQGLELASAVEAVEVHWVGALQIDHFFNGHPAGARIRKLFALKNTRSFTRSILVFLLQFPQVRHTAPAV